MVREAFDRGPLEALVGRGGGLDGPDGRGVVHQDLQVVLRNVDEVLVAHVDDLEEVDLGVHEDLLGAMAVLEAFVPLDVQDEVLVEVHQDEVDQLAVDEANRPWPSNGGCHPGAPVLHRDPRRRSSPVRASRSFNLKRKTFKSQRLN